MKIKFNGKSAYADLPSSHRWRKIFQYGINEQWVKYAV